MRAGLLSVVTFVLACGASPPSAPRPAPRMTAEEWTRRCSTRLKAAGRAALPSATSLTASADPSPWNPSVAFEAELPGGGVYAGRVQRGSNPCIDFDTDAPSAKNLGWSDGASTSPDVVHRNRRLDGDAAELEARGVPPESARPVVAALEGALEGCLRDARAVRIEAAPASLPCLDRRDECPVEGGTREPGDGCPDPARPASDERPRGGSLPQP